MEWIQTYTGVPFWPLAPKMEDIRIEDIAHSLSMQCRFNGHCTTFYSVAEHSVRVSKIVPPEHALWGLLHDAGEAYLTDLPRPVKSQMERFRDLEDIVLQKVMEKYGLSWPMPEPVHHADMVMLETERRDLMRPCTTPWSIDVEPLKDIIAPLSQQEAKELFLKRFQELCTK